MAALWCKGHRPEIVGEVVKTYLGVAHNFVSVKSTSHRLSHDLSQINSVVWDVAVNDVPKPLPLYALGALVLLEGAAFAVATIYLVVEIFIGDPKYLTTAIAYAVTAAVLSSLVIVVGLAIFRARPWVRGAVVCIAVLQLLVAYSIIITNAPTLGWIIVIPSVLLLGLLFSRPVLRATMRPSRDDDGTDGRTF
jgi:hypothetical protein